VSTAKNTISDESHSHSEVFFCPDPASGSQPVSQHQSIDSSDIASLRKKFVFLKDFSDDFIRKTPLEVLLKTETTHLKIKEFEKNKAAGDRLSNNRDVLSETFVTIQQGVDNRWDRLHDSRFLPGACCSANALWLRARDVIGSNPHAPVATYDMQSIGLGGFISKRGWIEIHNVGSDAISIKMFNINNCSSKISSKSDAGDDFKEVSDLGELKLALRVLREAMSFVHPWNKSIAALDGFMWQTDYCKADLTGVEKPASVLAQFCDYILNVNADRWRGRQYFVNTGEMKGIWDSFWGAKPESKIKPKPGSQGKKTFQRMQFEPGFFDDICRMFNIGKCTKAAGTCTTRSGIPLRHVCNFRTNPLNPRETCGKSHAAVQSHPPPTN
jgi:hypothetical protein